MKIFQSLKWDTFKHAHPWKVIECDAPNGVTIVCFHPILCKKFGKMCSNITMVEVQIWTSRREI